MLLHTVTTSPYRSDALTSCLAHACEGDVVLLIEDGVYAVIAGSAAAHKIEARGPAVRICALGPDLAARGIDPEKMIGDVAIVDYGGFVDLVTETSATQAWL